jgi:hypothetical protein
MSRVFLSYATPDKAFAKTLSRELAARGAEIVDPNANASAGENLWDLILPQLKRSDLMIFVVPRYEGQGKSALAELGAAKALGKRSVSVLPERVRLANNDVASVLGNTYSLDGAGRNMGVLADQLLSDLAAA